LQLPPDSIAGFTGDGRSGREGREKNGTERKRKGGAEVEVIGMLERRVSYIEDRLDEKINGRDKG